MSVADGVIYIQNGENLEAVVLNRPLIKVTQNIDNNFALKNGTYPSLRAQATTKADVGLGSVDNLSRAYYDGRYLAAGAKAVDADKVDGLHAYQFVRSDSNDTMTGDLLILKNNPWLTLDSSTAGAVGGEQGAGISIGESGKKGGAALHLTYTGDGSGHIGMGSVGVSGIPDFSVMKFNYQNNNVQFHGVISGNGSGLTGTASIRATGTTKGDVGLGSVDNYSRAYYDGRYGSHFNTSGTYAGLRAQATTKADVGLGNVGNYSSSEASTGTTVVRRSSSGDITARLFRSEYDQTNATIGFIMTQVDTATNNYLRPSTPAQLKASLNIGSGDVGGLSDAATTAVSTIRSGTTKANVGLSSVDNYSRAYYDGRYAYKGDRVQAGIITMWSGSITTIPSGWVLCNGANGTPDLRNRFVVGAGSSYGVGAVGGSADAVVVSHSHTASSGSAGYHSHTASSSTTGSHTHSFVRSSDAGGSGYSRTGFIYDNIAASDGVTDAAGSHDHAIYIGSSGSHTHSVSVGTSGESGTNKNLPPYYALAYIMKT